MDKIEISKTYVKVNGQKLNTVTDIVIHCNADERYDQVVITLDAEVEYNQIAEVKYRQTPPNCAVESAKEARP